MRKHITLVCLILILPFWVLAQHTVKDQVAVKTQCVEKESKPNKNGDVTITRTCTYQNYRSVAVGEPDYKGRTFWTSKLYLKKNGSFIKVSNANFFNENRDKLLTILNKQFNDNFKAERAADTDEASKECYGDKTELDQYKWDEISIEIKDDKFYFSISYGLGEACLSMDDGGAAFSIASLKPYLR